MAVSCQRYVAELGVSPPSDFILSLRIDWISCMGSKHTIVGDKGTYDFGLVSLFRFWACFSALSFAFFCKPSIRCFLHFGPRLTTSHTSGVNTTTTPDHITYVHPAPIRLIRASLLSIVDARSELGASFITTGD
jgi:hypothetical protein